MTDRSLADLIALAKEGNQDAFRGIFDRLHGRLLAYARGHVTDKESAQDLVQDTMVGIWDALPSFEYRGDESFLAFVFMILKRAIMKTYGKEERKPLSLEAILEESGDRLMPKETPEYEDHRTLLRVLGELSEGTRNVLTLRYWSGLSFQEIAQTLEINESAAKVRHHRAMNELRESLAQYGYGQD